MQMGCLKRNGTGSDQERGQVRMTGGNCVAVNITDYIKATEMRQNLINGSDVVKTQ